MHDTVIGTATQTRYGWISNWNTNPVPNGTYQLRSRAYAAANNTATSPPITITTHN